MKFEKVFCYFGLTIKSKRVDIYPSFFNLKVLSTTKTLRNLTFHLQECCLSTYFFFFLTSRIQFKTIPPPSLKCGQEFPRSLLFFVDKLHLIEDNNAPAQCLHCGQRVSSKNFVPFRSKCSIMKISCVKIGTKYFFYEFSLLVSLNC